MLGRVNISQGNVLFFGNKYNISRGSISFFNPTKIAPILDVDLQTKTRGVDVTLTVTGPPSHLGLTYRSDPPLEFSDIVALLATGRTPDDPGLALRGNAPTPSFEQLGALRTDRRDAGESDCRAIAAILRSQQDQDRSANWWA